MKRFGWNQVFGKQGAGGPWTLALLSRSKLGNSPCQMPSPGDTWRQCLVRPPKTALKTATFAPRD
ncbi:hypothetical protein TorRG33x02_015020 [Trema orientale]|uniref:Uncharacterized protein n=1 Tax=Trema orientale TaxID=63057 RepID=A0A2P5FXJ9_TREOI|nr:hypothetical protein TorRG33x02_015020 [Trema orientale]